jgi:hypothetical protein
MRPDAPDPRSHPPEVWIRRAAVWGLCWLVAAAVYLLLIDITDLPELLVGAGAATMAVLAFALGREQFAGRETIRARWFHRLARPLVKVPGDTARLCLVALRQLRNPRAARGTFRAVPFHGPEDRVHRIGQSALAEALGSFAPNTIVVGVDRERELILAHQLHQAGGAEAIDVLGLG